MPSEPCAAGAIADDARLLDWLAARAEPGVVDRAGSPPADATVVEWATDALTRACPIVTGLLAFDGRLRAEVAGQLPLGDHPESIADWGLRFATRLESDGDPWVSWAAKVDASTLVVERSRRSADPACPGDATRAILLITSGTDPRGE
jgi:hypothetical protein